MTTNLELWRTNVSISDDVIDSLVNEIKVSSVPIRNMWTTYNNIKQPESILVDFYREVLDKALNDLGLKNRIQKDFHYWMQIYGHRANHSVHDHISGRTLFSWVHFIRPTNEKCFCFLDSEMRPYYPKQSPGDFIAFPEWALHMVKPNISGKERVVIAGNMNYMKILRPNNAIESVENVITEGIDRVLMFQQRNSETIGFWDNQIQWDNPRK